MLAPLAAAALCALLVQAPPTADSRRAQIWGSGLYDAPGIPRLGTPRQGDWLDYVREPGQTVEELRRTWGPLSPSRRTVYFMAGDGVEPGTVEQLAPLVAAGLGLEWKKTLLRLDTTHAKRPLFPVLDAGVLIQDLGRRVPDDAAALILIVAEDLDTDSANFVFGAARADLRAGVFSTFRLHSMRRLGHVVLHEIGHVLGLDHCVFYACVMQGGNHLRELDSQPIHPCPVCLEKLRLRVGFDPQKRARDYAAALRSAGLEDDAAHAADALAAKVFPAQKVNPAPR